MSRQCLDCQFAWRQGEGSKKLALQFCSSCFRYRQSEPELLQSRSSTLKTKARCERVLLGFSGVQRDVNECCDGWGCSNILFFKIHCIPGEFACMDIFFLPQDLFWPLVLWTHLIFYIFTHLFSYFSLYKISYLLNFLPQLFHFLSFCCLISSIVLFPPPKYQPSSAVIYLPLFRSLSHHPLLLSPLSVSLIMFQLSLSQSVHYLGGCNTYAAIINPN